jgi:hypothetical protein
VVPTAAALPLLLLLLLRAAAVRSCCCGGSWKLHHWCVVACFTRGMAFRAPRLRKKLLQANFGGCVGSGASAAVAAPLSQLWLQSPGHNC